MIGQLESLFIKMWRAASLLSVGFGALFALILTSGIENGLVRAAIVVGVFVVSGIFAGSTAWAMSVLEVREEANRLAKKQLRVTVSINDQLLKLNSIKNTARRDVS